MAYQGIGGATAANHSRDGQVHHLGSTPEAIIKVKIRDVEILAAAVRDMQQGRDFYDIQQTGVGDYFSESVLGDLGALRLHAGIHHKLHGYYRSLCQRFPYAIYYQIRSDVVQVVAVLDMRREPTWIQRSLLKRSRGKTR